jgi:methylmalonyl-CoA carboxyltransferase large subunit
VTDARKAGTDTLAKLQAELARLAARVAALEAASAPQVAVPAAPPAAAAAPVAAAPAPSPAPEPLSDELVLVIGAAVAAFLGKRPHLRQIQLVDGASWAHAGRVSIQASHAPVHNR